VSSLRWAHRFALPLAWLVLLSSPVGAEDVASAPAETSPSPPAATRPFRLHAAAELGLVMPVGIGAVMSLPANERLRYDFDFFWEPSNYFQSYGLGAAYHPWDRAFFVGVRGRFMQLHSPFSRGFHARRDNQLTFGPELGVRFPVGRDQRFLPFASLGMSFFPSETSSLPPLITLNVGLGYGVLMDR